MALSIHTNYAALVTQNSLNKFNAALTTNQQRLGTGYRINSAADDAAGLQIATRLNAQSRGMSVAIRNTNDAVSMLQTAEGAFQEVTDILLRMKDLATQSANGTNSTDDRTSLQAEYDELGKELANIIKNTKYAGQALFHTTSMTGAGGTFGTAVSFQIGAAAAETMSLNVKTSLSDLMNKLGSVSSSYTGVATAGTEVANGATATITTVDNAIKAVGTLRANFGATINRLNHTANNLANMKDNTDMASGRITDADFALESANMSKNSMLMQSGISMLKQAGQMPGLVMSLLG